MKPPAGSPLEVIDRATFDVRRRFSEAPASDARLRATQAPGNRRLLLIHRLLADAMPAGDGPVSMLELGVGHGELVRPMAELLPRAQWTAVEHPRRRYLGSAEYRRMLEEARCRVVAASLTSLPLPLADASFDLVTFSEVLEHLPSTAVFPLLVEVRRLLRPGGRMVITSPNLLALQYRLLLLLGRSPFDLPVETDFAPETFGHIRLYAAAEIEKLGRRAGWQVEKVHHQTWMLGHYGFEQPGLRWAERILWFLDRTVGSLHAELRDAWAMVLRRPRRDDA
ncbi:MAG: class I SAM-dependent methyltransferase [Thermoanaerobaculia bacterium]|nr:class I SAM-dependent methyltransferase [Thermoanaerobaculia bacterium]